MNSTAPPLSPILLILLIYRGYRASRFYPPDPANWSPLRSSPIVATLDRDCRRTGPGRFGQLRHYIIVSYQRNMILRLPLPRHSRLPQSMSQRNARRPLILLFVLLQALAIITLTIPPTNPISLLNSTITSTAPTLLKDFVSHNVTSPGTAPNMMDYHITGTSLILRITETGHAFSKEDVNTIIDRAIRRVVRRINTGSGGERIQQGRFWQLSQQIDMHISALVDANFTYFLLGKHALIGPIVFRFRWFPSCESMNGFRCPSACLDVVKPHASFLGHRADS